MTRDDIERMAFEASGGMLSYDAEERWTLNEQEVIRLAALVAAAVLDRPRRRRSPLRRDAERYRWLRGMIYDDRIIVAADRMLHGEALDAAVDAAMRQEQPR